MRVFLAGIIQGSNSGRELHDQSYRERLKTVIRHYWPDAEVICPIDLHPTGIDYDPAQQREAFSRRSTLSKRSRRTVASPLCWRSQRRGGWDDWSGSGVDDA